MPYKNKEAKRSHDRWYYYRNTDFCKENGRNYRLSNPWLSHYYAARRRCTDVKKHNYKSYGGKGIRFRLTKVLIIHLWMRDKAEFMNQPSLHRISSTKDYSVVNCCFIEKRDNVKRKQAQGRQVVQLRHESEG